MINIFVTKKRQSTITNYLKDWSSGLWAKVNLITYEAFGAQEVGIPPGPIIFADLERLNPPGLALAGAIAEHTIGMGRTVLNDPRYVRTRFDLLQACHDGGINDFRCYEIGDEPQRWPVFVRSKHDHGGKFKLCYDHTEIQAEVDKHTANEEPLEHLMLVEYVDTKDEDGCYRSYSILRIDDQFLPRHAHVSEEWVVRSSDSACADKRNFEEARFDQGFYREHLPLVKEVFELANMQYGRCDYGIVNGKIQVWEINSNPMLFLSAAKITEHRVERTKRMAAAVTLAFNTIEHKHRPKTPTLQFKPVLTKAEHTHVSTTII